MAPQVVRTCKKNDSYVVISGIPQTEVCKNMSTEETKSRKATRVACVWFVYDEVHVYYFP